MSNITDKLKEATQPSKEIVVGSADKGFTPEEDSSPVQGHINKDEDDEDEDQIPGADNLW